MRFLFEWQHVGASARVSGPDALAAVLAQLEGYEAPAVLWETEVLPARVRDYSTAWLDDLCTAGRTLWTRLRPTATEGRSGGTASLRAAPVLLLPRRQAALWRRLAPLPADDTRLGARERRVVDHLSAHGASFFDEVAEGTRLLRSELEDALAGLVARGRVHCDSYAGLRALLLPASKRSASSARRRRGAALFGIEDAGRWALVRQVEPLDAATAGEPVRSKSQVAPADSADAIEHVARTLLRRYGVVAWRLLEREPGWLPAWRDLVRVYRRLEARGEIRGGRFIAGLSGEQFALPEAIGLMREVRRRPLAGETVCLAAADPANLLGSLVPGPKVPRVAGARVLYRDGVPLASWVGGQVEWLEPTAADAQRAVVRMLSLDPGLRAVDAVRPTVRAAP
ncbi:MAG: ATP-dependent DNA helicase, partial [Caldimonas sp.]